MEENEFKINLEHYLSVCIARGQRHWPIDKQYCKMATECVHLELTNSELFEEKLLKLKLYAKEQYRKSYGK